MENQACHQPTYSEQDSYPDKTSSRTLIAQVERTFIFEAEFLNLVRNRQLYFTWRFKHGSREKFPCFYNEDEFHSECGSQTT